ncbi:conserved hypothetical protein [Delftia phage PhiW-14]|uniref:PD-(D/E)XK endonuclease-like domain-containing protein n=1 Tax=Delftia phage PhiW-14 TaxID=665032 RepID=C9DG04_BPW14|nr:exonuclease [Delftia phage PhiW-14]ACV50055.1 conserved hypothetical protein [Delftia phage PhiW-14]
MDLEVLKRRRVSRKHYPIQPIPGLVPESVWGPTTYDEIGRWYTTPTGKKYKSVTTFLGLFEDPHALDDWRKRVGEAEAERISQEACDRGEMIHAKMEAYVLDKPGWEDMPVGQWGAMFQQIRRRCEDHLDRVCYTEHALWSDELEIAGRVDMCGVWKGELAIIDFKNKSRFVKREYIESYFVQTATYALMHKERYGVLPTKLVIIAAVDDGGFYKAMVFEEDTVDFLGRIRHMAAIHKVEGINIDPKHYELMEYKPGQTTSAKPKPTTTAPKQLVTTTQGLGGFFA